MPLYEYECDACARRFEVIQKFSDAPVEVCEACGKGPVRRLLSSPAIQFKGSGWYITDYAQKGKSDASAGKTDTPEKSDKAGKTDKAEAASEKKTEKKSDAGAAASPTSAKS